MDTYYAKQPILSLDGRTFGYELLYRTAPKLNLYDGTDADRTTADVLNNIFFGGNPTAVLDGKHAFVNFTDNLLREGIAKLLPKEVIVVEVLETVTADETILSCLTEIHNAGYIIALDDYVYNDATAPLLPFADIVKIDFRVTKEEIESTAAMCRENGIRILAEKIETAEEAEYAKSLGATLMQGYYFARPLIVTNQVETPMQRTFFRLVSLIEVPDPDLGEIEMVISADAVMTLKLLRLINALRHDTSERISTVHQALVMLGINKIRDWVYLVGLQRLSRGAPEELMKMAFFRAKFCQTLAKYFNGAMVFEKELYLMGLMSIVCDIEDKSAIDLLPVSDNIKKGLKGDKGIFAVIFRLAIAFERADWKMTDGICERLGIDFTDLADDCFNCGLEVEKLGTGEKQ